MAILFFISGFLCLYTHQCADRRPRIKDGRLNLALPISGSSTSWRPHMGPCGFSPDIIKSLPTFIYATVKGLMVTEAWCAQTSSKMMKCCVWSQTVAMPSTPLASMSGWHQTPLASFSVLTSSPDPSRSLRSKENCCRRVLNPKWYRHKEKTKYHFYSWRKFWGTN